MLIVVFSSISLKFINRSNSLFAYNFLCKLLCIKNIYITVKIQYDWFKKYIVSKASYILQKLQELAKKKAKKPNAFESLRAELLHILEDVFITQLQPPVKRPLHEIQFFDCSSTVKRHLIGMPRAALTTALSNPHHYLQVRKPFVYQLLILFTQWTLNDRQTKIQRWQVNMCLASGCNDRIVGAHWQFSLFAPGSFGSLWAIFGT